MKASIILLILTAHFIAAVQHQLHSTHTTINQVKDYKIDNNNQLDGGTNLNGDGEQVYTRPENKAKDAKDCEIRCNFDPQCNAFVFFSNDATEANRRLVCVLKGEVGSLAPMSGATSGTVIPPPGVETIRPYLKTTMDNLKEARSSSRRVNELLNDSKNKLTNTQTNAKSIKDASIQTLADSQLITKASDITNKAYLNVKSIYDKAKAAHEQDVEQRAILEQEIRDKIAETQTEREIRSEKLQSQVDLRKDEIDRERQRMDEEVKNDYRERREQVDRLNAERSLADQQRQIELKEKLDREATEDEEMRLQKEEEEKNRLEEVRRREEAEALERNRIQKAEEDRQQEEIAREARRREEQIKEDQMRREQREAEDKMKIDDLLYQHKMEKERRDRLVSQEEEERQRDEEAAKAMLEAKKTQYELEEEANEAMQEAKQQEYNTQMKMEHDRMVNELRTRRELMEQDTTSRRNELQGNIMARAEDDARRQEARRIETHQYAVEHQILVRCVKGLCKKCAKGSKCNGGLPQAKTLPPRFRSSNIRKRPLASDISDWETVSEYS